MKKRNIIVLLAMAIMLFLSISVYGGESQNNGSRRTEIRSQRFQVIIGPRHRRYRRYYRPRYQPVYRRYYRPRYR